MIDITFFTEIEELKIANPPIPSTPPSRTAHRQTASTRYRALWSPAPYRRYHNAAWSQYSSLAAWRETRYSRNARPPRRGETRKTRSSPHRRGLCRAADCRAPGPA